MKNLLVAAFIVAFTLSSANAQDDLGRWYIGGNIGKTKFGGIGARDGFCDSVGGFDVIVTNCSSKDTSVKLYGGYNPHKNFSVESGFIEFGEVKVTFDDFGRAFTVKSGVKSFFLAGMGKIRVPPNATLFGKFGLHRWNWKMKFGVDDCERRPCFDLEDDGVDFFYGIGGEVALSSNQKIKLRMEYEMFELENFNDDPGDGIAPPIDDLDTDLKFLSIGVTYTF